MPRRDWGLTWSAAGGRCAEEPFELGAALCPVALGLVARFEQQGVLPAKRIEALLAQRLHLGFAGAARAEMFSGSRCASGW